jgi:hypothetical protein
LTATASQRQSTSQTQTSSLTPTQSKSITVSQSQSFTQSQMLSTTPSLSATQSLTGSLSVTTTPTGTSSGSSTNSQECTLSRSGSGTPTQLVTPSSSCTTSQSGTQSPTPSSSLAPYFLFAVPAPPVVQASPAASALLADRVFTLAISDSWPSKSIALLLNRCPTDVQGGALTAHVDCSVVPAGPSARMPLQSHTTAHVSVFLGQNTSDVVLPVCDSASSAPVSLNLRVTVGAFYRTGSGHALLTCRVTSSSALSLLSVRLEMPLSVRASLWPTWDDAFIVLPTGLLRSTRFGRVLNGTSALLSRAGWNSSTAAAAANLQLALEATRATWESADVTAEGGPTAAAASPAFSVTLTGATVIVLRGGSDGRSFVRDVRVRIGLSESALSVVSDDGAWAALTTPTTSAACATHSNLTLLPGMSIGATDCGYVSFVLNATAAATGGVALACPPICAGSVRPPDVVLLPDGRGGYVFGSLPPVGSGRPPQALTDSEQISTGIYYATACSASGASGRGL